MNKVFDLIKNKLYSLIIFIMSEKNTEKKVVLRIGITPPPALKLLELDDELELLLEELLLSSPIFSTANNKLPTPL